MIWAVFVLAHSITQSSDFLNDSYAIIRSFGLEDTLKETPYFAIIGIGGKSP